MNFLLFALSKVRVKICYLVYKTSGQTSAQIPCHIHSCSCRHCRYKSVHNPRCRHYTRRYLIDRRRERLTDNILYITNKKVIVKLSSPFQAETKYHLDGNQLLFPDINQFIDMWQRSTTSWLLQNVLILCLTNPAYFLSCYDMALILNIRLLIKMICAIFIYTFIDKKKLTVTKYSETLIYR